MHHDIWDYDNPLPPRLLDVVVDGEPVPALVQTAKQAFAYALNRVTGQPIWPIEERPVPAGEVPNEWYSPTQPFPTRPAAFEMQGLTVDDLIDFTPELREAALEIVADFQIGPLYSPLFHTENRQDKRGSVMCPGSGGGANIPGGPAADPETGILYVPSVKSCMGRILIPGDEADDGTDPTRSGTTVVEWHYGGTAGFAGPEGLPIFKPPYGRITAIDMNTGETLWWIPNGDTPERVADHRLLRGIDIPNTGQPSQATALVTRTLLMYGEGREGEPRFHAADKRTGEPLGTVEMPAPTQTAPVTFLHEGRQYVVMAVGGDGMSASLVAVRLRDAR